MAARKVLCIAPGRRPTELDTQLREQGWEVVWADDLATARRLQSQLQLRLCLLLIDRVNLALTAQIESAVRSITDLEWVAAVPPGALELPAFRDLLLDAFLDFHVGPIQSDSLLPMLAYAHRRSLLRTSGLRWVAVPMSRWKPPTQRCFTAASRTWPLWLICRSGRC